MDSVCGFTPPHCLKQIDGGRRRPAALRGALASAQAEQNGANTPRRRPPHSFTHSLIHLLMHDRWANGDSRDRRPASSRPSVSGKDSQQGGPWGDLGPREEAAAAREHWGGDGDCVGCRVTVGAVARGRARGGRAMPSAPHLAGRRKLCSPRRGEDPVSGGRAGRGSRRQVWSLGFLSGASLGWGAGVRVRPWEMGVWACSQGGGRWRAGQRVPRGTESASHRPALGGLSLGPGSWVGL